MVTEANTAVIQCGHLSFCYECIDTYHRLEPYKGCPVCNQEILLITRIFMDVNK